MEEASLLECALNLPPLGLKLVQEEVPALLALLRRGVRGFRAILSSTLRGLWYAFGSQQSPTLLHSMLNGDLDGATAGLFVLLRGLSVPQGLQLGLGLG